MPESSASADNNGAIQYLEPLEERGHLNENNEVILWHARGYETMGNFLARLICEHTRSAVTDYF